MRLFHLLRLVLCLGLACSFCLFAAPPNVVLIMADDLNNDMGAYGHPLAQTPHLDQLADEGVNFNRAYNQFPLCGPSRVSMMTGLYPDQNGMRQLRGDFRKEHPKLVTLSQYFGNHGYRTARVGKIYHQDNPNGRGTDQHDDHESWQERYNPSGIEMDFTDIKRLDKRDGQVGWYDGGPKGTGATLSWLAAEGTTPDGQDRADPALHTDGMVATKSIELIREFHDQDQPFFLAVGFFSPHTPFVAPRQFFDLYEPTEITVPEIPDGYFQTLPEGALKHLQKRKIQNGLDPRLARETIHGYLAAISFMDSQAGRVLAALDDPNGDGDNSDSIRDQTIVVFVSDHGYHMGEHDTYQKMTLFDNAARQPMIIAAPGAPAAGQSTDSLVELVDLYPTLAELAGLPRPKQVAGVSLGPIMRDAAAAPRDSALTQIHNGYTLRTGRYRYTRYDDGGPANIELYDIVADPAEMRNLAHFESEAHAEVIAQLDEQLSARVNAAGRMPE